jgi:shikimate dehydrogenase
VSGPVRLAVLGDPLAYTLSPVLHRAGLAALGLPGESQARRVPPERLGAELAWLRAAGWRGANLTHPLKQAALAHLGAVTEAARHARSVNTVSFDEDATRGDTTDGDGFTDLLRALGIAIEGARVTLLGAGGAARSLALALLGAGAVVTVWARRRDAVAAEWAGIPAAGLLSWAGPEALDALNGAELVVNATPVADAAGPCALDCVPPRARIVDLVYGAEVTPWVRAARAGGRAAVDGLGPLVFQARRSLERWTGRPVPLEPLQAAVRWPR